MPSLEFTGLPVPLQWVVGATLLLVFLGALFVLVRRAWRALSVVIRIGDALPALVKLPAFMDRTDATLEAQNAKIDEIHHEVNYNNGSSVKDAIARVETTTSTLAKTVRGNTTKLTTMQRNQGRIEKGVKGLYDRVDANEKTAAEDRANIAAAQKELEDTRPAPRRRATTTKE